MCRRRTVRRSIEYIYIYICSRSKGTGSLQSRGLARGGTVARGALLRVRLFLGIFMKQRGEIKIYYFLIQARFELKKI